MSNKELKEWFNELIDTQKKYVELCGDYVCEGNLDSTVQFWSGGKDAFEKLAAIYGKDVTTKKISDEHIEHSFTYKSLNIIRLEKIEDDN